MMDWGASGIVNTYRYELIHPVSTNVKIGDIECVTGGRVDYGYRTDCRAAATLDFDGEWPSEPGMVRIWHDASLGDETFSECMGTFVQEPCSSTIERGSQVGSVSLYSPIYKLNKDIKPVPTALKAGTDARAKLRSIAEGAGCECAPMPNVSGKLKSGHVWDGGESAFTECDRLADALGAWLDVDVYGRLTCEPYTSPIYRAMSGYIPSGAESVVIPGIKTQRPDICNKVIVRYQDGDTEWVCKSVVPDYHPWAFANIGYWSASEYSVNDISSKSQLQKYADAMLASVSFQGLTYAVKALYLPNVKCGEIWAFDNDGSEASGLVATKSVELTPSMVMELTIEEVR